MSDAFLVSGIDSGTDGLVGSPSGRERGPEGLSRTRIPPAKPSIGVRCRISAASVLSLRTEIGMALGVGRAPLVRPGYVFGAGVRGPRGPAPPVDLRTIWTFVLSSAFSSLAALVSLGLAVYGQLPLSLRKEASQKRTLRLRLFHFRGLRCQSLSLLSLRVTFVAVVGACFQNQRSALSSALGRFNLSHLPRFCVRQRWLCVGYA